MKELGRRANEPGRSITESGKEWLRRINEYRALPWWKKLFKKNPIFD